MTYKRITIKQLVEDLSDVVNGGGGEHGADEFAKAFHKQHRTLQAEGAEFLLKGLYKWAVQAAMENNHDPRNQTAICQVLNRLNPEDTELPLRKNMEFAITDLSLLLKDRERNNIDPCRGTHLNCYAC